MYLCRVPVRLYASQRPHCLVQSNHLGVSGKALGSACLNELFSQRFKPLEGAYVMPDTFVKLTRHLLQRHCCLQHGYYGETASGCSIKEPRVVYADTAEGVSLLTAVI